ncbi:MAG: hypothetical protein CFE24_14110 [Flavobacterium sp. BFFFF2]|nr:MAG: hypothetical protein CFE24_14110 [Flavobacterium sp. BFFFF2]
MVCDDPKENGFPGISTYNYCFNNPINLIDPDGEAPVWKPTRNGDLIAEKGANVETLAKYLHTSVDDVLKRFKDTKTGINITKDHVFKVGSRVKLNNNMTRSIHRSKGTTAEETQIKRKKPDFDPVDSYMCQESVITGSLGIEIGNINTAIFNDYFTQVKSFDELEYGKSAVFFTLENSKKKHYMLPH